MNASDSSRKNVNQIAVLFLLILISAVFLRMIWSLLLAVIVAAILAGLTSPLYKRLLRMVGGRKAIASAATLMIVILVVVIPLLVLVDIVALQAVEVSQELTPKVNEILDTMNEPGSSLDRIPFWDKIEPYGGEIAKKLGQAAEAVGSFLIGSLSAVAQGAVNFFFSLFIMLYSLFFFLMNGRETLDAAMRLVPLRRSDQQLLLDKFVTVSRATLKGTLVIGIVQGGLAGIAFAVVGIQGAVFWGTVMAVLSVLPGIGTALVWVPAVAFLVATGHTVPAIGLFLWCAIVVGSADNILRPRLVGKDTEMPDLLVMLSTFGGLALFGAVGLVLGPVIAALFLAVAHMYADTFSDVLAPSPKPVGDG